MNAAEVVIGKVESNGMAVVLYLLGESIGEPGKPPHRHAHGEVLAFDIGRANVSGIGNTTDRFHIAANASCRTIPRLICFRGTVDFVQLRVIGVSPESLLNRSQVRFVLVCGDLESPINARGGILHERER